MMRMPTISSRVGFGAGTSMTPTLSWATSPRRSSSLPDRHAGTKDNDNVTRGKAALRAYSADGLRRIPDLRF